MINVAVVAIHLEDYKYNVAEFYYFLRESGFKTNFDRRRQVLKAQMLHEKFEFKFHYATMSGGVLMGIDPRDLEVVETYRAKYRDDYREIIGYLSARQMPSKENLWKRFLRFIKRHLPEKFNSGVSGWMERQLTPSLGRRTVRKYFQQMSLKEAKIREEVTRQQQQSKQVLKQNPDILKNSKPGTSFL